MKMHIQFHTRPAPHFLSRAYLRSPAQKRAEPLSFRGVSPSWLLTCCAQLGATKAGWSQSTPAPKASRGPAAATGPRSAAEASGTAPTSQQSPPAAQELIPTVSHTAAQKVGTCTGKPGPGGHVSPRCVPPSSTDSETSGGCPQGRARVCHRAGFWQATVHELTVAFDVSSSNNLSGFVQNRM